MIHVAIIEDDPEYRQILTDVLDNLVDVETVTAFETAEPFLEAVATGGFDLVLIDVTLPTMSGIELLGQLRNSEVGHRIPSVMLSNSTSQEHVEQAYDAGARGYLVKPLSISELEDLLEDLVSMWSRMARPAPVVA